MNINHLKYFKVVCQYKNITTASEELFVSQPAITNAIKELEKEYDLQLFHKVKNKLVLTDEGQAFYDLTCPLLDNIEEYKDMVLDINNSRNVQLQIGVPPVLGTFLIKRIIPSFYDEIENIDLKFVEISSINSLKMLNEAKLDFAIGVNDHFPSDSYELKKLYTSELVVAVSNDNPLTKKKILTNEDIKNQHLAIQPRGSYHYDLINKKFKDIDFNLFFESSQISTIKYLLLNMNAMTILYKDVFINDPDITCIPLENSIFADICLIWRKYSYIPAQNKKFIKYITSKITGQIPE